MTPSVIAMFVYQYQSVWLLWQSKHAVATKAQVVALSHAGCTVIGGFEWSCPYGITWLSAKTASKIHKTRRI
jgi:hypothetical protein